MPPKIQKTPFSRVFLLENRAGPATTPAYQTLTRAMGPAWPQGDVTPIRAPDPNQYGQFITIDELSGGQGLPSMPLEARYAQDLSELLRLVRMRCRLDIQVHMGECKDPRDFNGGWHKVLVLEAARFTDWGTGELGALDSTEDAVINETVPATGLDLYEIKRIAFSEFGKTEVVQEVIDIQICDAKTCGACGLPSDGCQKVFALTLSAGGSPGLPAEIIYSEDEGETLGQTNVTTLAANEDPDALACVGTNLVVVSEDSCSLHYAPIADILNAAEAWVEMAVGFVTPAGCPRDIFSLGSRFTWIVGLGGYVYFSSDVTAAVEVQDAGVATNDDLNAIHGFDENNLVAVGDNNAVILTRNGGTTWVAVTGPLLGMNLNTIWMRSEDEWFVGSAGGVLYYTQDAGATWVAKAFPGSGAGQVRDIQFSTPTVGYMAHDTAAPLGRILRTIDGGNSWYVLPEDAGNIPANARINALAACGENVNIIFGAGLATGLIDGFLVKAA